MTTQKNFRNSETFNMLMGFAAVLVLGFGTATAAISTAPKDEVNPAMRPLATGPSLQLQAAYGEDDEDCVWVTAKSVGANGKVKLMRKLECSH